MLTFLILFNMSISQDLSCPNLTPFKDILQAPEVIQKASKAVVRIRDEEGAGTGFFISKDGRLVTNHHVIGPENCLKEGCYFKIDFGFQRGIKKKESVTVFSRPITASSKLDLTLLQLYEVDKLGKTDKKLSTPDFVEFSKQETETVKKIYVVGHPMGGLKKWTLGDCFKKKGDWRYSTHCCLGGNSGSPVFDSEGKVQGLVHRASEVGAEILSLEASRNSGVYSSAKSIVSFLGDKKGKKLEDWLRLSDILKKNDKESVLSSHALGLMYAYRISPEKIKMPEMLYSVCSALVDNLDSEDFSEENGATALYSCEAIENWVNCQDKTKDVYFKSCPNLAMQKKWLETFNKLAKLTAEANHEKYAPRWQITMPSIFEESEAIAKAKRLVKVKELFKNESDDKFLVLSRLIQNASRVEDLIFGSVDFNKFFLEFDKEPYYEHEYESIAQALLSGWENKILNKEVASSLLQKMFQDKKLPISIKIELESSSYELGLLE